MALCDRNSHASAMPCWSVCHCECAQIAFSLRSYILCKQENYRSFLTSEHSPCLLCCTVQAEWGLSIKGSPPRSPESRTVQRCRPAPGDEKEVVTWLIPSSLLLFFPSILECAARLQLASVVAISGKRCGSVTALQSQQYHTGVSAKNSVCSLEDKSFSDATTGKEGAS